MPYLRQEPGQILHCLRCVKKLLSVDIRDLFKSLKPKLKLQRTAEEEEGRYPMGASVRRGTCLGALVRGGGAFVGTPMC